MTAVTLNVLNADGTMGTITVDPALQTRSGRPKPTKISSAAFFGRFTDVEHSAIWAAAGTAPGIGPGLVQGLATGTVDLTSAVLKTWMDGLVAVNAITAARETEILIP